MERNEADPKLTLDDRLHPSGAGVPRVVEGILPAVVRLIDRIEVKKPKG